MKPFEIFKPGTHTPMGGKPMTFSEAEVQAAAKAYDPALQEAPAVVGHPANDGPAYAWVKGLAFQDGALVAELDQVEPAFAEMVETGRFKKVSPAFYAPDHPANPTPGKLYLRHIGFLGAMPPAVKGLKAISFASDDTEALTFEFADASSDWQMSWVFGSIGRALQAMRELIIAERGEDAADKAIPKYDIEEVHRQAGAIQERARKSESPAFSETNPKTAAKEQPVPKELQERETELNARQAKLDADALAFAETQKKARRDADKLTLDALSTEGKLAPGMVPALLDFMDGLDSGTTLEFGEGEAAQKKTPHEFFHDLLKQSGKVIEFGEHSAPGDEPATLPTDPEEAGAELARRAIAFAEDEKAKGNIITIDQAVTLVGKQKG